MGSSPGPEGCEPWDLGVPPVCSSAALIRFRTACPPNGNQLRGAALDILDGKEVVAETPETVAASSSGASGRGPQVIDVAEREGFEPSVEGLPLHVISSHADSATLASLRY